MVGARSIGNLALEPDFRFFIHFVVNAGKTTKYGSRRFSLRLAFTMTPTTNTIEQRRSGGRKLKSKKSRHVHKRVGFSSVDHPQRTRMSIAGFIDEICEDRGDKFKDLSHEQQELIRADAKQRHEDYNLFERMPELKKIFDGLGGVFPAPKRKDIKAAAEMAAMRRTPFAEAVREVLTKRVSGSSTKRLKVSSLFERMAYGFGVPRITAVLDELATPSPTTNYVYDGFQDSNEGQDLDTIYRVFGRLLKRHEESADVLIGQNLEIIKELSQKKPQIGKHCAIDATILPGAFQQYPVTAGSQREEVLLRGKNAGSIYHGDDFGRGWYTLVIADIATGLPLIWRNLTSGAVKVTDVLELVTELQERWPECPIESLVGDSEFAKAADLSRHLIFGHGIQPVFALRENTPKPSPHAKSLGAPKCCDVFMELERPIGFISRKTRRSRNLEPGDLVEATARMIWKCKHCGHTENLYVDKDPMLHTFYPRQSHEKLALKRIALMRKRNVVEGVFSQMKMRGKGLRESPAPGWMDEKYDCDWLIGGTLFSLTLSRYVHHTGLYKEVEDEMNQLDLLPRT